MRNVRDHLTGDLFERWGYLGEKRLKRLRESWPEVFRKNVIGKLPTAKLAVEFDPEMGRPTLDIPVMIGALILQQIFNLTDQETVESVAFNIAWQYALDVRSGAELEMTDRTLRNYRKLVIDLGLDEVIFAEVTDELIKAFKVDTSKQRMDSTAFKSSMRELTRLGTFVETISKFIRELKRRHPVEYERIDKEVIRKYVDREGEGCFGQRPIETRKRLPEAAETLYELIDTFRGTAAEGTESFGLMKRVFEEQCEVEDDGKLRIKAPEEVGCENVNNPSDPDSTYNGYKGQGYTAQVLETYTEDVHGEKTQPDIITYVAINKMTQMDTQALKPALDEVEERGIKPEVVIADTPYGAYANRIEALNRGVEIVAPSQPLQQNENGKLSLEDFELDESGLVVKCPAGYAPKSTNAMKSHMDARFDKAICLSCDLRYHCPCGIQVVKGKKPRIWYRYSRVGHAGRLRYEKTDKFRDKYRWRAGIEGTMSRLKNWLKLDNLRVRGRPAVSLALRLKALGLNILRCAVYMAT